MEKQARLQTTLGPSIIQIICSPESDQSSILKSGFNFNWVLIYFTADDSKITFNH